MTDTTHLDVLPYLSQPASALTTALHARDLRLSPAIVRPHPAYAHEILLVRPRAPGFASADWVLPARSLPTASSADRVAGALRALVAADTGLDVCGVVGGGLLHFPGRRRSSAASSASGATGSSAGGSEVGALDVGVFYVVKADGELKLDGEVYAEHMWAKAAEVPALQLRAEVKRAVEKAFELAGAVV